MCYSAVVHYVVCSEVVRLPKFDFMISVFYTPGDKKRKLYRLLSKNTVIMVNKYFSLITSFFWCMCVGTGWGSLACL